MTAALSTCRGAVIACRSASVHLRGCPVACSDRIRSLSTFDENERRRRRYPLAHSRTAASSRGGNSRRSLSWTRGGFPTQFTSSQFRNDPKSSTCATSSDDSGSPLWSSSSEGGAGADVGKAASNTEFIKDHLVDPGRAVFPWRHSVLPLPRLIPDDPAYREEGGVVGPNIPPMPRYVRRIMHWNAASALGVPLWRAILTSEWEEELAEQFMHAFRVGVAGMLANTYSVPMERIAPLEEAEEVGYEKTNDATDDKDRTDDSAGKFAVDFDQTLDPLPEITDIRDEMAAEEKAAAEGGREEECPEIKSMLERDLRKLYQTAHEHARHKLQIRLQTTPTAVWLESLMIIPCVTREHVEHTPALRHSFRNMWKHLERRENELGRRLGMIEVVNEVASELQNLAYRTVGSDGVLQSTVVAQVSVRCDEVFTVRDVDLDEVVQGDPESRVNDVVHLVRFEMVVGSRIDGDGDAELGSWQITDWDDLLEGNVFFM